jgi:hypothetical protein
LLLSRRIRRHAAAADRRTFELLEESRQVIGTRHAPVLVETDAVDSPALFGLLRPKLLLPTGLIRRLNESELRHVFLHELAHLRRHDVLLNWLAALLQILHWFNPMIWFGFARMRADREFACDALALTRSAGIDRAAYGTTILKLVSDLTPARPVAGLVGISEGKAHLKRRLRNIASHRKPTYWSTVFGTLILPLLAAVSLTNARGNRDAGEPNYEATDAVPQQIDSSNPGGTAVVAEPELAPETQSQPDSLAGGEASAASEGNALPSPNPLASTVLTYPVPGRQRIQSELDRIILNEFECDANSIQISRESTSWPFRTGAFRPMHRLSIPRRDSSFRHS